MENKPEKILSARPPSICWEGVAPGWMEGFPCPQSPGRALMTQQEGYNGLSSDPGDSGINSMENWDYSVELECLSGPEDLQIAAELGKSLLEKNKEMENCLKQNKVVMEDQAMEIEYLTKQTSTLREVNENRLRIYEQLEISLLELEKIKKRLTEESLMDKAKIKSLTASVHHLESRCEELQMVTEEKELAEEMLVKISQNLLSNVDRHCQKPQDMNSQEECVEDREQSNLNTFTHKEGCNVMGANRVQDAFMEEMAMEVMQLKEEVDRLTKELTLVREESRRSNIRLIEIEEQVEDRLVGNKQLRLETVGGVCSTVEQEVWLETVGGVCSTVEQEVWLETVGGVCSTVEQEVWHSVREEGESPMCPECSLSEQISDNLEKLVTSCARWLVDTLRTGVKRMKSKRNLEHVENFSNRSYPSWLDWFMVISLISSLLLAMAKAVLTSLICQ